MQPNPTQLVSVSITATMGTFSCLHRHPKLAVSLQNLRRSQLPEKTSTSPLVLPKDSWLAFGGRLDPKLFAGTTLGITSMKQTFKMSDAEVASLTQQCNTPLALQDGSEWIAMYTDGKFPAVLFFVQRTKICMETMDAYMGFLFKKMMSLVKDTSSKPAGDPQNAHANRNYATG